MPSVVRLLILFAPFMSPPLTDEAVTDVPFTALVPTSMLTDPELYAAAQRRPRSITPLPEIVILSVGWIFALIESPATVPVAEAVV